MILLSFDIEEFDTPLEYQIPFDFKSQMQYSVEGTIRILDLLKKHHVKATFYCTAQFAKNAIDVVIRIVEEGHELASHGFYHSSFEEKDLLRSKEFLETIIHMPIKGFRMARMMPVSEQAIYKAGYIYNSSLNPTYLPKRYNNFNKPRTPFMQNNVFQLPASVTPYCRIPLFWLSLHNLPLYVYKKLAWKTYKKDGYLNLYFHPWEFVNLHHLNLPFYVKKNSGYTFVDRLEKIISFFKYKNVDFSRTDTFVENYKL